MKLAAPNLVDPLARKSDAALTARPAGSLQGFLMVSTAWLAVMGAAVIAPVLPRIAAEFHNAPNAAVMVSFVATLPALFIALLSAPFGFLADRVGHRSVLLWGVLVYGFLGVAPFWLHSLWAIVLSRAGVGITEAAVITCGTALLGDYFSGSRRERWFAIQTASGNLFALVSVSLAGVLGAVSWRDAFLMYGFSFLLLPLLLFFTWDTRTSERQVLANGAVAEISNAPPFRWSGLIGICGVTIAASISFYVVVVQLGFLLTERGFTSPKVIGIGAALALVSMPLGSLLSQLIKAHYTTRLAISFLLSAVGFLIMALSRGYASTVLGAAITSVGSGLSLPTLVSWALAGVPQVFRGRATGAFQSSFAFGQFVSPLFVLALAHLFGGRAHAVLLCGACCAIAALAFIFLPRSQPAFTRTYSQ